MAILHRLEYEGIIDTWDNARGFNLEEYKETGTCEGLYSDSEEEDCIFDDEDESDYESEDDDEDDEDEEDEEDDEDDELWTMETGVKEVAEMVRQLVERFVNKKTSRRASRRSVEV
jgi:hypothetical protein